MVPEGDPSPGQTLRLLRTRRGTVRLVGYSDGAVIALLTALRRPEFVDRLVLISGVYNADGWINKPDHDAVDAMPSEMIDRYAEVSPDGREHFSVLGHRLADMAVEDLGITADDLGKLDARTLVMAADDDLITLEHTVSIYRSLPDSELAVVPGTSHDLLHDKPEVVTQPVQSFLTTEAAPTAIPIRRAQE